LSRYVPTDADFLYDKFVLLGEKANIVEEKHVWGKQEKFVISEILLRKGGSRNNSSDIVINFTIEEGEIVVQNIAFQKSMFVW
jgi:hypothetical protein